MALAEQQQGGEEQGERQGTVGQQRLSGHKGAKLPLGARVGLAFYGLCIVAASLAPEQWMSEIVWALLFVGCVLWEMVGVFKEKHWSQEPLTRLYRDRLMKLPGWGKLFRIGFLFLFVWWLAHWLLPGF